MPSWLSIILISLGILFGTLILFSLLRYFVFPRFTPNKWVILGLAVITIASTFVLPMVGISMNTWGFTLATIAFAILLAWFIELMGWFPKMEMPENTVKMKKTQYNAPPVIKSKAKPNRLKNTDMEVIEIKDYQKKKKNKNKK